MLLDNEADTVLPRAVAEHGKLGYEMTTYLILNAGHGEHAYEVCFEALRCRKFCKC